MEYLYILLAGLACVTTSGVIWRFISKPRDEISSVAPRLNVPSKRSPAPARKKDSISPNLVLKLSPTQAAVHKPPIDVELLDLRRELMAMVGGVQSVYDGNIEIARKDLARRGIFDRDEKTLIKRAIEILVHDRR